MNRFITFGAGGKQIQATKRLESQVQKLGIFDMIIIYEDDDIEKLDDFWHVHGNFVKNNPFKYGYGIWKPYLILRELLRMEDGEKLFYANAGCQFDLDCENPKEEYGELVKCMDKYKIISSFSKISDNLGCKPDLVIYLDMYDHPEYNSNQIETKCLLIEKCDETLKLVKEWYENCSNYCLLNNEHGVMPIPKTNWPKHHDEQSIFSLLVKKNENLYEMIPKHISIENVICLMENDTGTYYPACRVLGSHCYSLLFGDDLINSYQVIHMSKLIRKYNPEYIFESGFGTGRTMATMLESCRKKTIKYYLNCEKNYTLYEPVSIEYKERIKNRYPVVEWCEMRSSEMIKNGLIDTKFPTGIDWATIDGDPTFEGCLCELIGVYKNMKKGGIMYIVCDRLKRKNYNIMMATNFFVNVFKLDLICDEVMCAEISYIIV